MEIRQDKSLFLNSEDGSDMMPPELWRKGQPGDKDDTRDEMCVARKKPGNQEIQGVDDYQCEEGMKHYVVCEQHLD